MNKQSMTQSTAQGTTQTVADSQPEPDSTVPLPAFDSIAAGRAVRFWSRQLVAGKNNGASRSYAICDARCVKFSDWFFTQALGPVGPLGSDVAFGRFEISLP